MWVILLVAACVTGVGLWAFIDMKLRIRRVRRLLLTEPVRPGYPVIDALPVPPLRGGMSGEQGDGVAYRRWMDSMGYDE